VTAQTGSVGSWEAAAHRADGEEKWRERGPRSAAFEGAQVRGAASEKRGGFRGSTLRGSENREERGGPGSVGDNSGGRPQPPASERGRRHCCSIGASGGVRAMRA
jgi:hypothetical protein